MLQAAVFDMDGLLVDSEPFWQQAQVDVFTSLGVKICLTDTHQTIGQRIDHVVEFWHSKQPWQEHSIATVTEMIVVRVEELIKAHKPMLPGVLEAIEACEEMGLKIALASSSPMRLIKSTLKALSLESKFSAVLSAEALRYGKPHPEVYINAADALGVNPKNCIAFEDSVTGLLAAKAAQMKGVAIPDTAYASDPRWTIADRKLNSLLEVNKQFIASIE